MFVWDCNWILFMHGWFWPIRLIYLIRWKSVNFFKKTRIIHRESKLDTSDGQQNNFLLIFLVQTFGWLYGSKYHTINHTDPYRTNNCHLNWIRNTKQSFSLLGVGKRGVKKHEVYEAAFGGYLSMTYILFYYLNHYLDNFLFLPPANEVWGR